MNCTAQSRGHPSRTLPSERRCRLSLHDTRPAWRYQEPPPPATYFFFILQRRWRGPTAHHALDEPGLQLPFDVAIPECSCADPKPMHGPDNFDKEEEGAPFPEALQYQVDAWSGRSKPLFQLPGPKINLIYGPRVGDVSDIKLIRTDTTLDLSQKAEKR